jgi:hypothetical protein
MSIKRILSILVVAGLLIPGPSAAEEVIGAVKDSPQHAMTAALFPEIRKSATLSEVLRDINSGAGRLKEILLQLRLLSE